MALVVLEFAFLGLRDPPAAALQVLEFKGVPTMPGTTLFFETALSLNLELGDWLDWLVSSPRDLPGPTAPVMGLQMCAAVPNFHVGRTAPTHIRILR